MKLVSRILAPSRAVAAFLVLCALVSLVDSGMRAWWHTPVMFLGFAVHEMDRYHDRKIAEYERSKVNAEAQR